MPTVRYLVRNEYGLADPELYRAADKDDPEALLEGMAMAGIVGVLRQLGDLAEFAAEVFHNLHEEVMATSARGHGLMLRVLQIEAEFPSIEKAILSETDHSNYVYSEGIDWHANLRVEQNLVIQGDMPRFILDSYEECRGPPRLFMLDKFDVAGAGACLTRYSNPSFFKTASPFSEMMEELQREKRAQKPKKKGSYWRSGETTESLFTPIIDYLQFTASEQLPGKVPARLVKLKHRKLRVLNSKKSYMEGFLAEESFELNDSKSSLRGCPNNKIIDGASVQEVLPCGVTDQVIARKDFSPVRIKEVSGKVQNQKREVDFLGNVSVSSCLSQKNYPNSQNAKEAMLAGHVNEVGIHAFDISSDEIDFNLPPLQLAVQNNILADSGFMTDDDHDSYRSDDIGSELENYVDALNIMESEIETDSESRSKLDPSLFKRESHGINPDINGQLELQPQSSRSGISGSFDTSVTSAKVKDGMLSMSQSTVLVNLPDQQPKVRTVFEDTSHLEISHDEESGKLERMSENMTLVLSTCLRSNETCYQRQLDTAMAVPASREAVASYCVTDLDLKVQPNMDEAQSRAAHSDEPLSSLTKNTPEIDEHIESSYLTLQTNHIVGFPTCKERSDIPTDVLEEMNPIEYIENRISENITNKSNMQCVSFETQRGDLPEKALAECSKLLVDERGKPLEVLTLDKNDYISGRSLPNISLGSTVMESQDTSKDLLSEDSAMKISTNYMEDEVYERKQFNPNVLFSVETHKVPLVESNESGSYGSTQTSEIIDDVAYISDERGSPHGSQNNSVTGQLSGYTEKIMYNDLANALEMPEVPQTQEERFLVKVSLHVSVEKDNEADSVENLSPKSSSFSREIVSSIFQSENFAGNISATREAVVHLQLPSSSGNIDTLGYDDLISPTILYKLEHFSDVDEQQEFSNGVMLKPLSSSCGEDPDTNQLHREASELIEINGEEQSHDGLEFASGSTKLSSVQHDLLLLGESKNNSLAENGIPKDSINDEVLSVLESAKLSTFDVQLQEDPISKDDTQRLLYIDDIEEAAITGDSTLLLQSENKSYLFFTVNEEKEMFFNPVSRSQSSALELLNSSKEDKLGSKENVQYSDSKSENFITDDDTDNEVLSLLQSSHAINLDAQFQEDRVSEDAALNLHKQVFEELNGANSVSNFKIVTEDGTDSHILCLSESSNLYSFDVQTQSISEDSSLYQCKPVIQELAISSDLTFLKFESKLLGPLCENGDQTALGLVSSSQLQALDLSNSIYATIANHSFDNYMEESVISSKEDEKHSDLDVLMQHFQADAERSEKASVSQVVDDSSTASLNKVLKDIEPYIRLDDETTIIRYNLEEDCFISEPEPKNLLDHGCKNELNMTSLKTYENEQIEENTSLLSQVVSENPGSSIASEVVVSGSLVADFNIPFLTSGTQETFKELPGETISSFPIQDGIEETPPLPPLPPMQWRMGKPQVGSLIVCEPQPVMKTNPFIFQSITGSSTPINPLPPYKEKMSQHAGTFVLPFTFKESLQNTSLCTDGQLTESLKLFEYPVVTTLDQRQQIETSGLCLLASSEEGGKNSRGAPIDGENTFTVAPSLKDVAPSHPDLLEAGYRPAVEERRPELVKLLPGLELERSLEASIIDRDAIPPSSSLVFMPIAGDGMHQYGYEDYGGYGGDSVHYHKLSTPFPAAVQSIPHYAYHMFLRHGNSSTMYDIMLQDMEGDKPNDKHHSILIRPRDPLIEAVAAHDKSTLRKVSELDRPSPKPKEDENNLLLEQIKTKSLNLKPAASKANMANAPSTNLKVAAILEKANAIRQACVGSDEDDDDNWNNDS